MTSLQVCDRAAMRLLDMIGALSLLVVMSPLMALACIGIRLTSPGPVLYQARRVGLNGKSITMYKFRSMRLDADKGSAITSPNDDRIFPFGSFLRASKIDELPQLLNILTGDMAFVGPRPEDARIVAESYTDAMRETLRVRPGLTSPGTLHYMRNFGALVVDGDAEKSYLDGALAEKLEMDRHYLARQTIISDLTIIAQTAWLIVRRLASRRFHER